MIARNRLLQHRYRTVPIDYRPMRKTQGLSLRPQRTEEEDSAMLVLLMELNTTGKGIWHDSYDGLSPAEWRKIHKREPLPYALRNKKPT